MSRTVVVDSSVAYKWLRRIGEESVEAALSILANHQSGEIDLVAPETLPIELASAVRQSGLGVDDVLAIVEEIPSLAIGLHPIRQDRLVAAARLAFQHRLTIYDALFLQLAIELDAPLVTADRRAFAKPDLGVDVRLL